MKLKKNKFIIIIIILVLGINSISLCKYDYVGDYTLDSQIAKAIINIEKDEIINSEVDEMAFPIEYNFSINNYKEDIINEIDFNYTIEIEKSDSNFPVTYVLIDCDNNKEIKLSDGKSEEMKISKGVKEKRNFKLYLQWRDIDVELADEVQIKLKINVIQSKEE